MMITGLLAFFIPLLIGLALLLLLSTWLGHAWVLVWMAPGAGMGVCSVLFFGWSLLFYPRFQPLLYSGLEAAVLAGLALLVWRRRKLLDLHIPRPQIGWGEGLLAGALAAALVFFIYSILRQTAENPLGNWDAWTLWNSRARYLLLGDAHTWRNAFSMQVNHSDYPYLLTGFIARSWVILGKDRTFVPALTAGLFTLSTVGLLGAAVARLRGLGSGLFACLLLVSLPFFAWTAASQYADMPVACYYLSSLVLLYLYFTEGKKWQALAAAGAWAAFALWTKNEGASFAAALIAAAAAGLVLFQPGNQRGFLSRLRQVLPRLLPGLAGLLPVLLLYLAYRTWLVPATDLFEQRPASVLLQQVTDLGRYWTITYASWKMFRGWGDWNLPYLPCLLLYGLVVGLRPMRAEERAGVVVLSAVLALTLLQYLGIYLITPHDLIWHMGTSYGRLLNQLLPGFLLLLFLATRSAFEK